MTDLETYVRGWESDYRQSVARIPLFDTTRTAFWGPEKQQRFVRLFYHARGHFVSDFVWHLVNRVPPAYRAVIVENLSEELGGGPGQDPHERLYADFAEEVGVDTTEETRTEESYLPFLRHFNKGHAEWILSHDLPHNWGAFAAYECLDNIDYANLYALAKSIGVRTAKGLLFFEVHMGVGHFRQMQGLLAEVWVDDPQAVQAGFRFIADHQLKMWRGISDAVPA